MIKCDLHIHTKFSDGALSPTEVIRRLANMDIRVASITDHDTIDGLSEAREAAKEYGVQLIDGIELSTYDSKLGEIHILGYGFELTESFAIGLTHAKNLRKERIRQIFEKLKSAGITFTEDEKSRVKGRVDIAFLLKKARYVSSVNEAFDKYLGKNGSVYVEAARMLPVSAVKMITEANGTAVLAHPWRFADENSLENLIQELKFAGLGGIEVYYPSHTREMRETLTEVAKRFSLIMTGGSDYHMDSSSIRLGDGNAQIDEKTLEILAK